MGLGFLGFRVCRSRARRAVGFVSLIELCPHEWGSFELNLCVRRAYEIFAHMYVCMPEYAYLDIHLFKSLSCEKFV